MGVLDFFLRRPTVYRLRKNYDVLREKTDRIKNIEKRLQILRMLDQIEPSIVSLEEHHMSNFEKKRTAEYVSSNLKKIKQTMDQLKQNIHKEDNYMSR